ncbi:MAG: leucine-rich repeat domain-containing protein [Eubacteriales bacterium]
MPVCGEVVTAQEVVDALEHTFDGEEDSVCNVCGERVSRGLEFSEEHDGTYSLSGIGTCTDTDITVPGYYKGKPVTGVAGNAFYSSDKITSITLPEGVESIGDWAFCSCEALTSISLPESLKTIGESAFYFCKGLKNITIPAGVKSIATTAFYACDGLESVAVAEGNTVYHSEGNCIIKTQSKALVLGCQNSVITSDGSVTSIGVGVFYGCTSLKSITVPDGVTTISNLLFAYCTELESVSVPSGVTRVGERSFEGCKKLKYNTYDNALYLGNSENPCVILIKAVNEDITSCTINENTKIIFKDAFYYCKNLTSVTIGNEVTSIGDCAFADCGELVDIQFGGTKAEWNAISKVSSWDYFTGNYTIHCTDGDLSK